MQSKGYAAHTVNRRASLEEILNIVCASHKIAPSEIMSKNRKKHLVSARNEAYYLSAIAGYSLRELSEFWELSTETIRHGTMMHAINNKIPAIRDYKIVERGALT